VSLLSPTIQGRDCSYWPMKLISHPPLYQCSSVLQLSIGLLTAPIMAGHGSRGVMFFYLQSLYYIKSWGTILKNDDTNCLVGSRQVATSNELGSQYPNTNEIVNKDFINWEIIHIYRTGIYLNQFYDIILSPSFLPSHCTCWKEHNLLQNFTWKEKSKKSASHSFT